MQIHDWEPTTNDRLCSKHFDEKWFYKTDTESRVRLLNEAVPTVFPDMPQYIQPKKVFLYFLQTYVI